MIAGIELPPGWSVDAHLGSGQQVALRFDMDGIGYVGSITIDFDRRGFCLGHGGVGFTKSNASIRGRGWRQRLVDLAIEYFTANVLVEQE